MPKSWTCHWQFRFWRPDINSESEPIHASGSNTFRKRGVKAGDQVYIISLGRGQLYLGGRMTVKRIVSRPQAVRIFKNRDFYEANEWVIDPAKSGTRLDLHRRLSPDVSRQVQFNSKLGPKGLCFVSESELDNQATRGVRELTNESAQLFDRIIALTDDLPKSDRTLTVTSDSVSRSMQFATDLFTLADEVPQDVSHREGRVRRIEVNAYERDSKARLACITAHGTTCTICGFSFGSTYGPDAEGYIHVHHLRPLSEIGGEYSVDPLKDLRPICPNCHAIVHLGGSCRTIKQVRDLILRQKSNVKKRQ